MRKHIVLGILLTLGATGKTGLEEDPEAKSHLDLGMVYVAPNPNTTERVPFDVRGQGVIEVIAASSNDHNTMYKITDQVSTLSGDENQPIYARNIDPVLIWPELDESRNALDAYGKSIYETGEG